MRVSCAWRDAPLSRTEGGRVSRGRRDGARLLGAEGQCPSQGQRDGVRFLSAEGLVPLRDRGTARLSRVRRGVLLSVKGTESVSRGRGAHLLWAERGRCFS